MIIPVAAKHKEESWKNAATFGSKFMYPFVRIRLCFVLAVSVRHANHKLNNNFGELLLFL